MSTDLLGKGFMAFIFSLAFAASLCYGYDRENGTEAEKGQKYLPMIRGCLLPTVLLLLLIIGPLFYGRAYTFKRLLNTCIAVFPHISLYYLVLLMVLPFIRKHICARTCSALWLIPNYLYITQTSYMQTSQPRLVLRVPGKLPVILMVIWVTGFTAVFLWNIARTSAFPPENIKVFGPCNGLGSTGIISERT